MELLDVQLELLLCNQCSGYLSTFPIHTYNNKESVCGNCPLITAQGPTRAVLYEQIAQNFYFPCKFKDEGCMEKLLPCEQIEHQFNCLHRMFFCPIIGSCQWQGSKDDIKEHFEMEHANYIWESDETITLTIRDDFNTNYIRESNGIPFLIQLKYNNPYVYCSVSIIGPDKIAQNYKYNMCIYTSDNVDGWEFPSRKVERNDNKSAMNLGKAYSLDITEYDVTDETFKCQLFIKSTKIAEANDMVVEQSEESKAILTELECRVCLEHISPPIYQCPNGHIICTVCKAKCVMCPTCTLEIGNIRNLGLESIAQTVLYPCAFEKCNATYKLKDKDAHIALCRFQPYKCPMGPCSRKYAYDSFMEHFRQVHNEQIMDFNNQNVYDDVKEEVFIMQRYDNVIFVVKHKAVNEIFCLSLMKLAPREDKTEYMYSVRIGANDKNSAKVYAKLNCFNYTDKEEDVIYLKMPIDFLKLFKNGIYFTYCIDISPK